jgi:hypothetical protein
MKRIWSQLTLGVVGVVCAIAYTNCAPGFSQKADSVASIADTSGASGTTGTPSPPVPPAATATPPPVSAGKVGVLMAVGHMSRSLISCDDGKTWIRDRSANDATRCWVDNDPNYLECDHTPYSATRAAIDFGDGYFYTAHGWGYDGLIRRSKDGVNWETILSNTWGGGVLFANGSLFALREGAWKYSLDHGTTWSNSQLTGFTGDDFDHAIPARAGNKMFALGRVDGAVQAALSTDGGKTWRRVSGFDQTGTSVAEGNNVIVGVGDRASIIGRSTDGGLTWKNQTLPGTNEPFTSNLIFNGTAFVVWGGSKKWTSVDGMTWTSSNSKAPWYTATVTYRPDTRTYVAILNDYDENYAKQFAYRSTDGENWSALDTAHFKGGHPIRRITFGEMDASACQ